MKWFDICSCPVNPDVIPLSVVANYGQEHGEIKHHEAGMEVRLIRSLACTLLGLLVFAFTFYSVEGWSAFGMGEAGAERWEGRPDFYGRHLVPTFGGSIGTALSLLGAATACSVLKHRMSFAAWLSVSIAFGTFLWLIVRLIC